MNIEALKLAASNPNLPEADREAARRELEQLEAESSDSPQRQAHPLETELLESAGVIRLAEVNYLDVHQFCSDRDWSDDAKALYFDHWLPAYLTETSWGRHQLDKTLDYLARDAKERSEAMGDKCPPEDPELSALINAWLALREVRRRYKASPAFAAMFTAEQITELGLNKED